jgi:kinesin family protein C2/C3
MNFFPSFGQLLNKAFGFHQDMVDNLMQKYKRELTLRRKYFNIVQDLRGNIRVFCRIRPMLKAEIEQKLQSPFTFPNDGEVTVTDEKGNKNLFSYDRVYAPNTTQAQVSEDTTEYIQSVMDGYNVSIFAYGQTGSGKTYTMEGPPENPGVNLNALKTLFQLSEERAPMFEYKIKVSIFEIYNEKIKDLIANLDKKKDKDKKEKKKDEEEHKILHLPDGGVEVTGLSWLTVKSLQDVINLNIEAKKNRSLAATAMNSDSSRSHMLLVVDVHGFNVPANIEYSGKLYLVDLAGSERVKKSAAEGQTLKEAQNINKSLAALGDVMQALQQKSKFIPYRNSTLTDLMANALGGNAKTVMFVNCRPTNNDTFETVSSLKFAERAGKVEMGQVKKNVAPVKKTS